jgi:hypothetical protein
VGHSLHRSVAGSYGNDVANWQAGAPTPTSPNANIIELQHTPGGTFLRWTVNGILQTASQLQGPWTNLTGATSPYQLVPTAQPAQYFRVQEIVSP